MSDSNPSPFDKEPAEGSRETIERQLARQEDRDPTDRRVSDSESASIQDQNIVAIVGRAALRTWGGLSRDAQEVLFEAAAAERPDLRHELALVLHELHPRTEAPSPKR